MHNPEQTIALKEANETKYWLKLLKELEYINSKMFDSIYPEVESLVKMLVASTKKLKENTY